MLTLTTTGSPPRRTSTRVSRSNAVLGVSALAVALWLGSTAPDTSPVSGPRPASGTTAARAIAPAVRGADTDGDVLDRDLDRRDGRR